MEHFKDKIREPVLHEQSPENMGRENKGAGVPWAGPGTLLRGGRRVGRGEVRGSLPSHGENTVSPPL